LVVRMARAAVAAVTAAEAKATVKATGRATGTGMGTGMGLATAATRIEMEVATAVAMTAWFIWAPRLPNSSTSTCRSRYYWVWA
jgi:lambda repressor-like predicted transcriptional regulator